MWCFPHYTVNLNLFQGCCAYLGEVYGVFKTFLKHLLEIHRDKELIEVIEYQNVFWSDFCQKWFDFGQILVRLLGEIGKIVSQIFGKF